MISRRSFLRKGMAVTAAVGGGAAMGGYIPGRFVENALGENASHFRFASFLDENPQAVFIQRTDASGLFDNEGMERIGKKTAMQFFRPANEGWGIDAKIVIKPNITASLPTQGESIEETHGIVTNPYYLGGFIEGMRTMGVSKFTALERAATEKMFKIRNYSDRAEQKNFELISYRRPNYKYYGEDELNWRDVSNGYILKHIPALRPVLDTNSFLVYMPTFKTHSVGIVTLSIKGQQGVIPQGYGEFCIGLEGLSKKQPEQMEHFQPLSEIQKFITSEMKRHSAEGYYRWESRGSCDEVWAHYTLEALSAISPDLCIVEGIVARDGNAFFIGTDYLYNLILVSRSPFNADMIGHYLAGHHPWNIGLFRIARERNFIQTVIPKNIDVYEITEQGPQKIENIEEWAGRYPLGCAHHSIQSKDKKDFVFLNAPITDDILKGEKFSRGFNFKIDTNRHPRLPIHCDYETENAGDVAITVHDAEGRRIKTLLHRHQASGKHAIQWDGSDDREQSIRGGTYVLQLCANGKKAIQNVYIS